MKEILEETEKSTPPKEKVIQVAIVEEDITKRKQFVAAPIVAVQDHEIVNIPQSPISYTINSPGTGTLTRKFRNKSEREVLVGTPVKEGHVNYMLMYDMLTGIRISVSRCNAKPIREAQDLDFTAAHKLAFDV